ncbi:MAG: sigma-70 family RNA polymerase sigma factor [Ruminococcaceae bacterium]|nr:sigma-70 family RNA polymerase sigma factor [Oscillospiraceae bacterium]
MRKERESKIETVLPDEAIIDLYWNRNEKAITETDRKYKRYLYSIAYNILHDHPDCEECLNDTYLGTWNSIPPTKPSIFQIFLSKIMRNTAVVRYKHNTASKRIPSEMTASLDELEAYIPAPNLQQEYLINELSRLLSVYLRGLPERSAFIFICRYYCSDRISDIAAMLHVSERTVFRELGEIREGLKQFLEKEGYFYA